MEKNRVVLWRIRAVYFYIFFTLLWLFLVLLISFGVLIDDASILHYCEMVQPDKSYSFVTNEGQYCLLDWQGFLPENVYLPLAFYLFFNIPSLVALFFLKR